MTVKSLILSLCDSALLRAVCTATPRLFFLCSFSFYSLLSVICLVLNYTRMNDWLIDWWRRYFTILRLLSQSRRTVASYLHQPSNSNWPLIAPKDCQPWSDNKLSRPLPFSIPPSPSFHTGQSKINSFESNSLGPARTWRPIDWKFKTTPISSTCCSLIDKTGVKVIKYAPSWPEIPPRNREKAGCTKWRFPDIQSQIADRGDIIGLLEFFILT